MNFRFYWIQSTYWRWLIKSDLKKDKFVSTVLSTFEFVCRCDWWWMKSSFQNMFDERIERNWRRRHTLIDRFSFSSNQHWWIDIENKTISWFIVRGTSLSHWKISIRTSIELDLFSFHLIIGSINRLRHFDSMNNRIVSSPVSRRALCCLCYELDFVISTFVDHSLSTKCHQLQTLTNESFTDHSALCRISRKKFFSFLKSNRSNWVNLFQNDEFGCITSNRSNRLLKSFSS